MLVNTAIKLNKIAATAPLYAALVPVNGKGDTIPFILNPQSIGLNFNAAIVESQIYKGNSPSNWVGYKPERYQINGLFLSGGGCKDVTPLINALKSTIKSDVVYDYVHGKRVITSVRVVSGNVVETNWLGGVPVEAEASLELMQVFSSPTVKVTVKLKMTDREVKDATAATVKLGNLEAKVKVDQAKGTISVDGKLFANWVGGKLVPVKDAVKPPIAPGKDTVKLPGGAVPVKPTPTPPKFTGPGGIG